MTVAEDQRRNGRVSAPLNPRSGRTLLLQHRSPKRVPLLLRPFLPGFAPGDKIGASSRICSIPASGMSACGPTRVQRRMPLMLARVLPRVDLGLLWRVPSECDKLIARRMRVRPCWRACVDMYWKNVSLSSAFSSVDSCRFLTRLGCQRLKNHQVRLLDTNQCIAPKYHNSTPQSGYIRPQFREFHG